MTRTVREIPAGEFKARCLKLMDEVRATRREVVITKRGKPVATLVPVEGEPRPEIFGCMRGMVAIQSSARSRSTGTPSAASSTSAKMTTAAEPLLTRDRAILGYAAKGHLRAVAC